MKPLILILLLIPSKLIFEYDQVTFKRDSKGLWESANYDDRLEMSANHEIWLVTRISKSTHKSGYCKFVPPNIPGPINITVIFPKVGFKMKQNLFNYQIYKCKKGTCWSIQDNNGVFLETGIH
jgi:hypothetical protein